MIGAGVGAALESAHAKFSALAAKGDAAAMAGLYAKDGAVIRAANEPIRGAQAIAKFWESALASGVATIELKTVELYGQDTTATELGEYAVSDQAGRVLDRGSYFVVWCYQGGEWKLLRDMTSTSAPAPKS